MECFIAIAFQPCYRVFQVNQDGLKLNGKHQLLVHADNVNILGRSIHIKNKNREAIVLASKETVLEINADKTNIWSNLNIGMQDIITM